uniref:hypothetical protein n=1 Tax=Reticulibacter mediterranei TaxID=2778369 RepID=UPI001C6918E5|nr:hypothetical protein [Reticulibacter mediterranei]
MEEVVRLYGLRMWVEESYRQVKHALGWSEYQVRSDQAMRRHWQLVCCAFSFCWYHQAHAFAAEPLTVPTQSPPQASERQKAGEKKSGRTATGLLAQSAASGSRMARTLDLAPEVLARVVATSPTSPAPAAF